MAKETGYLPKLVRDRNQDFSLKTLEERLEDARRIDAICRLQYQKDYCEHRPRVTEEFEEEEARIRAEKGILGELIESNIFFRTFFWPWRDSSNIDNAKSEPPASPRKSIGERIGNFWKRTKEYLSKTRNKICNAWCHTKEVVYCYWERGTNGWYFEVTPIEWTTPLFHTWPIAPNDVYWFPDAYFSNEPQDFNGPFAIGSWPVCDPIPRIPYECEIRCAVSRKWEQYKAWRSGAKCTCGDPKCPGDPQTCEWVRVTEEERKVEGGMEDEGRRGWGKQGQATEDDREGRTIEDGSKPPKKRRYDCDNICKRD